MCSTSNSMSTFAESIEKESTTSTRTIHSRRNIWWWSARMLQQCNSMTVTCGWLSTPAEPYMRRMTHEGSTANANFDSVWLSVQCEIAGVNGCFAFMNSNLFVTPLRLAGRRRVPGWNVRAALNSDHGDAVHWKIAILLEHMQTRTSWDERNEVEVDTM